MKRFLQEHAMAAAVFYTVVGVLPLYLVSAQAPRLQVELEFGKTELGYIVAAYYLVSSIASRSLGPSIDRWGATRGLRIAAALSIASAGGIALFGVHWLVVAAFLGLAGLANAFGQLSSNLAVAEQVRDLRQGLGFGLKQAAVPTGAFIAGLVVPLAIGVSWRWPFVLASVAAIGALAVVPAYAVSAVGRAPAGGRDAPLLYLTVAAAVAGGVGNSLASFVSDAAATHGFGEGTAARLLTLGAFAAIATRVASGWVADRRQRHGAAELLTILAFAGLGFAVLANSAGSALVFVAGVVLGFAGAWGWPGVMYYVVTRSSRLPAASSTGRVLAGAYLGTVILPPLAGWVAEVSGYERVFGLAAILAGVAFAAVAASRVVLARTREEAV